MSQNSISEFSAQIWSPPMLNNSMWHTLCDIQYLVCHCLALSVVCSCRHCLFAARKAERTKFESIFVSKSQFWLVPAFSSRLIFAAAHFFFATLKIEKIKRKKKEVRTLCRSNQKNWPRCVGGRPLSGCSAAEFFEKLQKARKEDSRHARERT